MKLPTFLQTAVDPPADGVADRPARVAYAEFRVEPAKLARILAITVGCLIVATFLAQTLKWKHKLLAFARFIDSDDKINIPSGFKILVLFASAAVVWAIARTAAQAGDKWAREWHFLAVVVAFLAVDETTLLHQSISRVIDQQFPDKPGPIHFSWILIYLPGAILVVKLLWKFFRAMAKAPKRQLAFGGLTFIGGAGLVEIFKGLLLKKDATGEELPSSAFDFTAAFSDSLEFVGMSIFLVAAVAELGRRAYGARIVVGSEELPGDAVADAPATPVQRVQSAPLLLPREDRPEAPDWWEPKT